VPSLLSLDGSHVPAGDKPGDDLAPLQRVRQLAGAAADEEGIMMASPMLRHALSYARGGLKVFPCKPRGKAPLSEHGFHDATTDEQQIRAWWGETPDANIGLPMAPNGLVAIDVDRHNGNNGPATLAGLIAEHGALPPTMEAQTGGDGRHLVYQQPEGKLVGKLGPGLDVKAEGYILAEPSVHPSGKIYSWTRHPETCPAVVLPAAWLALLRKPEAPASTPAASPTSKAAPAVLDRAAAYLGTMEPAISGAGGHPACFRAACAMAWGFDLCESDVLSLLKSDYNDRCKPPWSDKELEHKARDAANASDPDNRPRGHLRDARRPHETFADAREAYKRSHPETTPPPTDEDAPGARSGNVADASPKALATVHPFDLVPVPITWLIAGVLARGKRMVIGGEPKAGKSLLALVLAICAACRRSYLDKWTVPAQARTLIVSTEGGAPFASTRIQQLCHGMGLDAEEVRAVNDSISIVSRGRVELTSTDGLVLLRNTVAALQPDVLVLDPLADVFVGDENDSQAMKPPLQALSDLLDDWPQMSVVVVHHVGKASKERSMGYSLRGSSYLAGWYDSLFIARRMDPDLPRRLDGEHRFTSDPTPIGYRILSGAWQGPDLPSCKLELCEAPSSVAKGRGGKQHSEAEIRKSTVLDLVTEKTTTSVQWLAKEMELSAKTIGRYLDELEAEGKVKRNGPSVTWTEK
jgi:hypothetical protein